MLESVYDLVEDFNLLFERNRSLLIVDASKNVSELDYVDMLVDKRPDNLANNVFKELFIIVKLECQTKLVLESFPNLVSFLRLNLFCSK